MLTSRHALDRKKHHCGGHSWRGGLFTKQLKKWVKAVFLLGCYGCIFHGTGNSAQLCQNFGISGGGGFEHPKAPLGTPLLTLYLYVTHTTGMPQLKKATLLCCPALSIKQYGQVSCRCTPPSTASCRWWLPTADILEAYFQNSVIAQQNVLKNWTELGVTGCAPSGPRPAALCYGTDQQERTMAKKKAPVKLDGDPGMGGVDRHYTGKSCCWLTGLQMVHCVT